MVTTWQQVDEQEKSGVAIHNFLLENDKYLPLHVGDALLLMEELGDWYLGRKLYDKSSCGIFPKCYVAVRRNKEAQLPLVREATDVLREWGELFKHLYVENSMQFKELEHRMYELMKYRSEILSGTLPLDELRDKEHRVASTIDLGNQLLDLDMVVRDADCNILNPESTSTVQLFWQHQKATEDIKKAKNDTKRRQKAILVTNQFSHSLFVSVQNFVCKMNDETELLMSLYDGKENIPFTENYVVKWSHANTLHSFRALFTDLGSRDLKREKVYLVCHVVRVGSILYKEGDKESPMRASRGFNRKSEVSNVSSSSAVRRPFGLAVMDLTLIMSGNIPVDEEAQHFIPFIPCEKEHLEQTLKRALPMRDVLPKEYKGQGLWVSLKLLHGDLKQVREENPHLVLGNVSISRKMGFPEVILPGDVRNDLYLTLVSAEFSKGNKGQERNLQVSVSVRNEKGTPLTDVIFIGGGVEGMSEFKSVVYYHDDKPKWNEIFKVAVPIDEFKGAHIKFSFKHRSSNEAKDKAEKPFAMCFVKLMQENGTTLRDTSHSLCVYRIEHKKFDDEDLGYLNLPWCRTDVKMEKKEEKCPGLIFSPKESFIISTNVCSTKLTQNVDLLGLLNWTDKTETLEQSLNSLMMVDGEEVVKYLQDVLDALFSILMQNSDSELYDDVVFKCLLFIIGLVADRKYQHFEPVLDVYIQESFSATLAYNKLIIVLKCHIANACSSDGDRDFSLKVMKSLQYVFKFIVRSRLLFSNMNDGKGQEQFEIQLKSLLQSIVKLMKDDSQNLILIQAACLKYLPSAIPDIMKVFEPRDLSEIIAEMIQAIPLLRLVKQKMMTVNDIVRGPLFHVPEARNILLPSVLALLKSLLEQRDEGPDLVQQTKSAEKLSRVLGTTRTNWVKAPYCRETEVELCVKVLSDIMELLFRTDIGPTYKDVHTIMLTILRTVIQSSISLERMHPNVAPLVVIMLSIFRQMNESHFTAYINHFQTIFDRLDFLMEILMVFKDLVSKPVFHKDWCEMLMLQNSVILKSLRFFSHTINEYFFKPFEPQVWNNFFHCAIAFLNQPALQLETFSPNKRLRILTSYGDMRRDMGFEIRTMWFNLGTYKIQFVPGLVGVMLEMTLIPEAKLRHATIPIFFDMMQCEFYSSKTGDNHFTKRDSTSIKGHFSEFENEMIAKLDHLFEAGCGDEEYKDMFRSTMLGLCEQHSSFKTQGVKFVHTVARLMERLLEYRTIIVDENKENRMSCVVSLLDFYSEINRREMYIRYVNKLCELHLDCDNYTEAAFTLKLHSDLLNWSEELLVPHLKSNRHPQCHTHLDLKEALYHDSIQYFDKGKMWECALALCNELKIQYEEQLYDYQQLSQLYIVMSKFYKYIITQMRPGSEYFRVGFYGRAFPGYLQNKVFVYRGKEYERLADFSSRILNQFPNAEMMNKLDPPATDITEANVQYLQINKVDPLLDERKHRISARAPEQIVQYYRSNDVNRFQYSRRVNQGDGDNEFGNLWLERTVLVTSYPLPGIMMWFPVTTSRSYMVSPIENAIETMTASNKILANLGSSYSSDLTLPLNPLSMKIQGIVDAAVNGGIANYEKAFFTSEYIESHPEDKNYIEQLKKCIGEQVPLLDKVIRIHGERVATTNLEPFHARIVQVFTTMKAEVHAKYGVFEESDLNLRTSKPARRHVVIPNGFLHQDERNSIISLSPSEGGSSSSGLKSIIPSLSTATLKKDKGKEKRKSKGGPPAPVTPSSQWYTGPEVIPVPSGNQTIFELRQELQPKRPLRSEVEREKRLSRPSSGQFRLMSTGSSLRLSQVPGNRDSTGTTESNTSEEDQLPPPLPAKQRDSDYSNLPEINGRSLPKPPLPNGNK